MAAKDSFEKNSLCIKNYRATYVKLAIELEEYIEDGLLNDAIDFSMQSLTPETELEQHVDDSFFLDIIELKCKQTEQAEDLDE